VAKKSFISYENKIQLILLKKVEQFCLKYSKIVDLKCSFQSKVTGHGQTSLL